MSEACCARPALHEARAKARDGEIAGNELRRVEDAAIRDAVALQESAGLQAITDGEFRRGHYLVDFLTGFEGIVPTNTSYALAFKGEHGETGETRSMLTVTSKVRRTHPVMVEPFKFLKSVTNRTPKLCLPSPTWIHMRGGRKTVSESAYPDIEEFWADIVRAFHEEIADLAAAGCTYLQLDEISFAFLCDATIRERIRAGRARSRPGDARLCARGERNRRRRAALHDGHGAYLPRQFPEHVDGRRRL